MLVFYYRLQLKLEPYKYYMNNHLERIEMVSGSLTLFGGMIFTQTEDEVIVFNVIVFVAIIVANCYFILMWIYCMLKTFRQNHRVVESLLNIIAFIVWIRDVSQINSFATSKESPSAKKLKMDKTIKPKKKDPKKQSSSFSNMNKHLEKKKDWSSNKDNSNSRSKYIDNSVAHDEVNNHFKNNNWPEGGYTELVKKDQLFVNMDDLMDIDYIEKSKDKKSSKKLKKSRKYAEKMNNDRNKDAMNINEKNERNKLKAFSIKKKHSKKYIELMEILESSKNVFQSSQRSELKLLNSPSNDEEETKGLQKNLPIQAENEPDYTRPVGLPANLDEKITADKLLELASLQGKELTWNQAINLLSIIPEVQESKEKKDIMSYLAKENHQMFSKNALDQEKANKRYPSNTTLNENANMNYSDLNKTESKGTMKSKKKREK